MKTAFVDSYFYLALVSQADSGHDKAIEASVAWTGRTITTVWVLTEVADALADPSQRAVFTSLLANLQADPKLTIVPPTKSLFEQGIELYKNRPDKGWSLTDCISFVVMQDAGVIEALTADHHFQQAGFTLLLR